MSIDRQNSEPPKHTPKVGIATTDRNFLSQLVKEKGNVPAAKVAKEVISSTDKDTRATITK